MLHVELWESSCKSSSLRVGRKCKKGKTSNNYINLLFISKYILPWINVICLQDEYNINAVS